MSVKVENLEKSMAKITVEVDAADFEKAIKKAYDKDKNRFNIPGFRKGHAPLSMIEKMFGEQVFYEDALNVVLDETYRMLQRSLSLISFLARRLVLIRLERARISSILQP